MKVCVEGRHAKVRCQTDMTSRVQPRKGLQRFHHDYVLENDAISLFFGIVFSTAKIENSAKKIVLQFFLFFCFSKFLRQKKCKFVYFGYRSDLNINVILNLLQTKLVLIRNEQFSNLPVNIFYLKKNVQIKSFFITHAQLNPSFWHVIYR